jgi:hypothetical protein
MIDRWLIYDPKDQGGQLRWLAETLLQAEKNYYYYLFTAIGFAPSGSGPYTTQLQQNTYNKNKNIP